MTDPPEDRAAQINPVDPVFPRFFRNGEEPQNKLVGLIAYGLYEEARREWVDDFKGREKRFPLAEELRPYESSWTASSLDGLKNAAVQILASYADTLAREVENQALRGALRGSFVGSVVRWLVSAVLFSAAVVAHRGRDAPFLRREKGYGAHGRARARVRRAASVRRRVSCPCHRQDCYMS
jgi:hypothetical protein